MNPEPCRTSTALLVGCGYLGLRVGMLFLEKGWKVIATTTTSSRLRELEAKGFEPSLLDLARCEESPVWLSRHDAVVVAVAPGRGGDARLAFHDGPVACARRIAAAEPERLRRFVIVSSIGVYSERGGAWVDESSAADPPEERLRWLRKGEDEILDLARTHRFPAVVLRLSGIYGPGRSPVSWLSRAEMLARISASRGDAFLNWVRVEDCARAVLLAVEKGRSGEIYNITDDEPVRRRDFYGLAARIAGVAPPVFADTGDDLGKRCLARKAREELGFIPEFRTYREGLEGLNEG
jgi:nucleoside-diphosphate-sugar epimerase